MAHLLTCTSHTLNMRIFRNFLAVKRFNAFLSLSSHKVRNSFIKKSNRGHFAHKLGKICANLWSSNKIHSLSKTNTKNEHKRESLTFTFFVSFKERAE